MSVLEVLLSIAACAVLTPDSWLDQHGPSASPPHELRSERTEDPVAWNRGYLQYYVPPGFAAKDGVYDLIVHFHGIPTKVHPAFEASGFQHTILVTVNLGIRSSLYEERFAASESFGLFIDSINEAVVARVPSAKKPDRVALSAWSAGYGSIKQILVHEHNRERVDAVLLADGLHAGFTDPRARRIDHLRLAPFVAFARLAAQGQKLMALTHSMIKTRLYASTSETGAYMAHTLGLETVPQDRAVGSMEMTSLTERLGFRVHGYAGGDRSAHVAHLAHIDDTLLRQLRTWWEPSHDPNSL